MIFSKYVEVEVEINLSEEEIEEAYLDIFGGASQNERNQCLMDAADKLRDHGHNGLAFRLDEIRRGGD